MPALPEAHQLERLAQQRREEVGSLVNRFISNRIDGGDLTEISVKSVTDPQAKRRVERSVTHVTTTMVAGVWTPSVDTLPRTEEDEDPLIQQIRNI